MASKKTYVVTVPQLFRHLSAHRDQFPAQELAEKAGLPRSIVYNAYDGQNMTLETLQAIAKVCGGKVVIMIEPGKSKFGT